MKKYRNPNIPNKVFRRLRAGEYIRKGDYGNFTDNILYKGWIKTKFIGYKVSNSLMFYYREIPHLSNLPE